MLLNTKYKFNSFIIDFIIEIIILLGIRKVKISKRKLDIM